MSDERVMSWHSRPPSDLRIAYIALEGRIDDHAVVALRLFDAHVAVLDGRDDRLDRDLPDPVDRGDGAAARARGVTAAPTAVIAERTRVARLAETRSRTTSGRDDEQREVVPPWRSRVT
jgi:hypothetical protein